MSYRPTSAPAQPVDRDPRHRHLLGLLLTLAILGVLVVAFVGLPREGSALPAVARYAMHVALPRWKITEPVNEVVYGTRGFDTFGETFLLLAAVMSVVVLTRRREERRGYLGESVAAAKEQAEADPPEPLTERQQEIRRAEETEAAGAGEDRDLPGGPMLTPDLEPVGSQGPENAETMGIVVRTGIRVAATILAVAGLYLVAWGYSPGGGFPAGAVVLGVVLLIYAGFGYRRVHRLVKPRVFEAVEMAGAFVIILTEVLGLVLRGSFSANWLPLATIETIRSGGILQLFSGGELIEVGTGLTIVVFALLGMAHDWTPDHGKGDREGS